MLDLATTIKLRDLTGCCQDPRISPHQTPAQETNRDGKSSNELILNIQCFIYTIIFFSL